MGQHGRGQRTFLSEYYEDGHTCYKCDSVIVGHCVCTRCIVASARSRPRRHRRHHHHHQQLAPSIDTQRRPPVAGSDFASTPAPAAAAGAFCRRRCSVTDVVRRLWPAVATTASTSWRTPCSTSSCGTTLNWTSDRRRCSLSSR